MVWLPWACSKAAVNITAFPQMCGPLRWPALQDTHGCHSQPVTHIRPDARHQQRLAVATDGVLEEVGELG